MGHRSLGAGRGALPLQVGTRLRPDYRYIARFIRENLGGQRPPVPCLTATAKPDVKDEIQEYFRNELDMEVELLDGGASRD